MSKNLYRLIMGIVGGVVAIADAVVVYAAPPHAAQIAAALPIAATAINEILLLFVDEPVAQLADKV